MYTSALLEISTCLCTHAHTCACMHTHTHTNRWTMHLLRGSHGLYWVKSDCYECRIHYCIDRKSHFLFAYMYVSLSLLTVTASHGWRIGLGWPKPFLVIPLTFSSFLPRGVFSLSRATAEVCFYPKLWQLFFSKEMIFFHKT